MSDKQLLELAAKVVGITLEWSDQFARFERFKAGNDGLLIYAGPWNPLVDDGDALRLATDMGRMHGRPVRICIEYQCDGEEDFTVIDGCCGEVTQYHGDDPASATRRAIVRAAAEMATNRLLAGGGQ